ncbi:hypothetical protein [Azospirillum sp. sgz301742]
MNKPERTPDRAPPALPNPGLMMLGPMTAMRLLADLNRAVPASLLIAASPFFWAPPLWIGALMAARAAAAHGGPEGSAVTRREAEAAPKRMVERAVPRRRAGQP